MADPIPYGPPVVPLVWSHGNRAALSIDVNVDGLNRTLAQYTSKLGVAVQDAVVSVALMLLGKIQMRTPVDTGRARASWHAILPNQSDSYVYTDNSGRGFDGTVAVSAGPLEAWVATNVGYMCVASTTNVITSTGAKRIRFLRVGDKVLAQDGTYRKVERVWSFPATEKPDLVDLTVEWRKDRNHQLTLTQDHKILARVAGILKWIPAGELTGTEELWIPRKASPMAGRFKYELTTCAHCNKAIRDKDRGPEKQWRRYCSRDCRVASWRAGLSPQIGQVRSPTARQNISIAVAKQKHKINSLAATTRPTSCERSVEQWLTGAGLDFDKQVLIREAGAIVDFAVPILQLFVEADGTHWHKNQSVDIERDKRILAARPGWQILHFHFAEPSRPVTLESEPVRGAHYVFCNPGIASIVNATTFRPARILEVRKYRYEPPPPRSDGRGSRPKLLWDLQVEGMHSFVANGIIVSNSALEAGHSRQAPNGMVTISLLEMQGALETKVRAQLAGTR